MSKIKESNSSESVRSGLGSVSSPEQRSSEESRMSTYDPALPPISTIPSTLANWESSPQSPTPTDKQRPFKSKSKHNLAVFGAKITSTAASVGAHASKYKQREKDAIKESNRESVFVDVPETLQHPHDATTAVMNSPSASNSINAGSGSGGTSGGGGGGMLKSKMFKQSKSDLKSLRIKTDLGLQAARSSLNDRSPMIRGGSTKELDRIAAIGQTGSPLQTGELGNGLNSHNHHHHHHHLHHPHISFRKRDSPAAVLSSSASNSTLASEGTVYSFNQSNNNGPPSAVTSLHSFKTAEEGTAFLTSSWTLLTLRIQSVFKRDEALRIPVEDVNILVLMHFSAHYALAGTGLEILTRLDELLHTGLRSSSVIPKAPTLEDLADSWQYFHGKTLITLEAVFLPLQLEFDALGQVFNSPQTARNYWYPLESNRPPSLHRLSVSGRKNRKISIRRRALTVYRDVAVMPHIDKFAKQAEEWNAQLGQSEHMSRETLSNLLQCFTTLAHLETDNESQAAIKSILTSLQESSLKRHRFMNDHKNLPRR